MELPTSVISRFSDYHHGLGALINRLSTNTYGSFNKKKALNIVYLRVINTTIKAINDSSIRVMKDISSDNENKSLLEIVFRYLGTLEIDYVPFKRYLLEIKSLILDEPFTEINMFPIEITNFIRITSFILMYKNMQSNGVYPHLIIEMFEDMNFEGVDREIIRDHDSIMGSCMYNMNNTLTLFSLVESGHELKIVLMYLSSRFYMVTKIHELIVEIHYQIRRFKINKCEGSEPIIVFLSDILVKYANHHDISEEDMSMIRMFAETIECIR
jgi:hypothetical protein